MEKIAKHDCVRYDIGPVAARTMVLQPLRPSSSTGFIRPDTRFSLQTAKTKLGALERTNRSQSKSITIQNISRDRWSHRRAPYVALQADDGKKKEMPPHHHGNEAVPTPSRGPQNDRGHLRLYAQAQKMGVCQSLGCAGSACASGCDRCRRIVRCERWIL